MEDDYTLELEHLKGTKLYRYLESSDILNLNSSFKESIIEAELSCEYVPSQKHRAINCDTIKLQFNMRDEYLIAFYYLLYDHNMSYMIHEIINTIIENEDPTDVEYIIIFLLAVVHNDYTTIDTIISKGFDMNMIGEDRIHMTHDNIITTAYKISNNRDMIIYLLSNGGDINNEDCHVGKNACLKGDLDLVTHILDLDVSNDKLLSMFISAVGKKKFTIADKIINYDFKMEDIYQEILDNYKFHSDRETIKYLIRHGLDINKYGACLLRYACEQENIELIDFYLENKLIVDKKILNDVFSNSELKIIEMLAKNCTDLSAVEFWCDEYNSLAESLKNNGLDTMTFLKYLLKFVDDANSNYFTFLAEY